jgi:hypothetical protein
MTSMRSFCLAGALLVAACGDVVKVPDAALIDAYAPDSPQELTCGAGETVCNGSCVDPMTSELYCGNCNTQCTPTQACLAGTCVPANTSCSRVREIDPNAADGVYVNLNNGNAFYCDFTQQITYDDFRLGVFSTTPTGYSLVRASDLADPAFAKAFIAMFNHFGGVRANATFTAGNCCLTTVAGQRLKLGNTFVFPGQGTAAANCTFNYVADGVYTLSRNQTSMYMDTLPADFFTTNPPSEGTGCADSANPAYYVKRRNTLN